MTPAIFRAFVKTARGRPRERELNQAAAYSNAVEPIDRRITAAKLMSLRAEPQPARRIAELLRVTEMPAAEAIKTRDEIDDFVAGGDATAAAQLIHTAATRRPGAGTS